MMKIASIPTTWVLKHIMQEGGQIHKKRVEIVVTFTFIKLLCGEGLCCCTWLCEEAWRDNQTSFPHSPFVVVTTTTTLKTLFLPCGGTPPFLSKIRRMSWVPFYFTKQISQSSFSSIFPRFLVCTKVQACATHVPKVPEFIF
jgi:hypothetical protein